MFCPVCGKSFPADARFCSACGTAVTAQQQALPIPRLRPRIVRPLAPRMIAGICSGFGIHYGWDLALTRILFSVVTVLTSGLGLVCYVIAWIALPEAPYAIPAVGLVYPAAPGPVAPPAAVSGVHPVQTGYQPGHGSGTA